MIRTQIYLSEEAHKKLNQLAMIRREPMAKILRELVDAKLEQERQINTSGNATLRALAQLKLVGGPADVSTNIDHYLYGAPRK